MVADTITTMLKTYPPIVVYAYQPAASNECRISVIPDARAQITIVLWIDSVIQHVS